jgi:hypothetical protein
MIARDSGAQRMKRAALAPHFLQQIGDDLDSGLCRCR